MKKYLLALALSCVSATCFAMLPVSDANLDSAISHGVSTVTTAEPQLMQPWTAKDYRDDNLLSKDDQAILYSPYLLSVLETRQRLRSGKEIPTKPQLRSFLHEYDGITVIGLSVGVPAEETVDSLNVELVQDENRVPPYAQEYLASASLPSVTVQDKVQTQAQLAYIDQLRYRDAEILRQLKLVESRDMDPADVVLPPVTVRKPAPADKNTWNVQQLQLQCYFDNTKFDPRFPYRVFVTDGLGTVREFHIVPDLYR